MDIRELLGVFLAGALGTLTRAGALEAAETLTNGSLLANFSANTIGAFGLGFVLAHGMLPFPAWIRTSVTVGFFGSYTTFSAIALLSVSQPLSTGIPFLFLNLFFGVLAIVMGRSVAQLVSKENKK